MNSRERVLKALDHEEPDRVPLILGGTQSGITKVAYNNLAKYLGLKVRELPIECRCQQLVDPEEEVLKRLGIDFRTVTYYGGPTKKWKNIEYPDDSFRDEWGIRWKRPLGGHWYDMVEHPLANADVEDLDEYNWPDPRDPGRTEGLEKRAKELYEHTDYALAIGMPMYGMTFERAWYLRGYVKWITDLHQNPKFATCLLDKLVELSLRFYDEILSAVGDYIQVVNVGDDLGEQNGPIISLDLYRRMIKPWQAKLYRFIKCKTDAKLSYHGCGSMYAFINDLIDIGVDILNPVQPTAAGMGDPERLKHEFGDRICFLGAVDTQRVLPFGTSDDVRAEVEKRIRGLAPKGGYVLGAVHNIQPEVKPENMVAMYESALRYGRYPLELR